LLVVKLLYPTPITRPDLA
jgi:hypothetical protein